MRHGVVRIRAWALRCGIATACSVALGLPGAVSAAAPTAATVDLTAVEHGFTTGRAAAERGDYREAIRVWTAAAALLPENAEHRENRTALYQRIAGAYQQEHGRVSAVPTAALAVAREAVAALGVYAQGFSAAYPGEPLPATIVTTRQAMEAVVAAANPPDEPPVTTQDSRETKTEILTKSEPEPEPPPPEPPTPRLTTPPEPPQTPTRRWRPLVVGGGVALAGGVAMLAMIGGGYVRIRKLENRFEDPANSCTTADLQGDCADIYRQGQANSRMVTAGYVVAPLLLGAGAALIVVGLKRKSAIRHTLAPTWSPTFWGLAFERRF